MLYVEESIMVSYQQHGSLATTACLVFYQHRRSAWHRAGLRFIFELEDLGVVMNEKKCSGELCLCPLPATGDNFIKWVCQ